MYQATQLFYYPWYHLGSPLPCTTQNVADKLRSTLALSR